MFKEEHLTRKIIGLAMDVHNKVGPGFQEKIYHQAMTVACAENDLFFESEKEFRVFYKDVDIGLFRTDLVISKKIVVELKAISGEIPKIFYTQTISYLKASGLEVGLLINFGNASLDIKRFANYKNFEKLNH